PRISFPGVVPPLAGSGHGFEAPDLRAAADVEGTHGAARTKPRPFGDGGARDDQIAIDRRGGGDRVLGRRPALGDTEAQVDGAAVAEISRRPPRLRIEREEPPVVGPAQDAPLPLPGGGRSEEHTSELQSRVDLVCRLPL